MGPPMRRETIHTTGRIVVDTESFNRFSTYDAHHVKPFDQKESNGFRSADEPTLLEGKEDKLLQLTPYHQMLCRSALNHKLQNCRRKE